ncbi:hypothetical protein [Absidia glauca]|uniref:Uncharacterized protein n=1 Tax=Absidia glauca TaxID=4829 RepID=A0A168SCI5_ABSGL|nr:hypothetical protein [Absidia glauca]
MDNDQLSILIQSYRQYENDFIKQQATDLTDALLYGEVAFCLAGLKPAVLFDLPPPLDTAYIDAVVRPWMQHHSALIDSWVLRQRRLYSPEIQGSLVYFFAHTNHPIVLESFEQADRCDMSSSEENLAVLLDYPGRLPRSMHELETMREVVYYNRQDMHIVTTFACQLDQHDLVQQHFERYHDTMLPIGVPLGFIFRRPT